MITIKLPYKSTDKFYSKLLILRRQYSICVRYCYNRLVDNKLTQSEIYHNCLSLNNISDMNGFIILSAITEAKALYKRYKENDNKFNIIFGGKYNLYQRLKNKITKEQYKENRLLPFSIVGDALKKGNRHFELNIIDENFIEFKLNKKDHYILHLPDNICNNYKQLLYKLQQLNDLKQNQKGYCYSIKLDDKYIYISFEEFKVENKLNLLENRYIGIDLNPTNIGISVCENINNEIKIIDTKLYDFNNIINKIYQLKYKSSDKRLQYLNNKLNYELYQISKSISNLSKHYHCKYIFVEDLQFKPKNKQSKQFNILTKNLWKRNKFISNLTKRCNINNQQLIEVNPAYSSFIGNLQYDYVDSINASIEIGRRGYEYKILKQKDKFYPAIRLKNLLEHQWKETADKIFGSWKKIYQYIKNFKIRYRVSLEDAISLHRYKVFSLGNIKSLIYCYNFI